MPTWRQHLMEQRLEETSGVYQWHLKEGFEVSQYYAVYHAVLNNRFFLGMCRAFGYRIIFMPHPIMQPYKDRFQVSDEVIILPYADTSWRDLFAKCSIMITDYSSVAFDFAYLKKPVIYFQFDRNEFLQKHTYRQGYFDYDQMGFGPVITESTQLCRTVFSSIIHGCRMNSNYEKRVEQFFLNPDFRCCERIYSRILAVASPEISKKQGLS